MEFSVLHFQCFPYRHNDRDTGFYGIVKMTKSAFCGIQLQWCDIMGLNHISQIIEPGPVSGNGISDIFGKFRIL